MSPRRSTPPDIDPTQRRTLDAVIDGAYIREIPLAPMETYPRIGDDVRLIRDDRVVRYTVMDAIVQPDELWFILSFKAFEGKQS